LTGCLYPCIVRHVETGGRQGRRQKNFQKGPAEKTRLKNSTIKLLSTLSVPCMKIRKSREATAPLCPMLPTPVVAELTRRLEKGHLSASWLRQLGKIMSKTVKFFHQILKYIELIGTNSYIKSQSVDIVQHIKFIRVACGHF